VAPTEVGGTHPVLLEAMAAGNCILVNNHKPNVETVGDAGLYFDGSAGADDLTRQLERILDEPALVAEYGARALKRSEGYSWDAVTDQYEALLEEVIAAREPGRLPAYLLEPEPELEPEPAPVAVTV
jgi:glycosyltransferase involved in cell wall biosynthesis